VSISLRFRLSGVTPRTARARVRRALAQRGFVIQRQPARKTSAGIDGWHEHLRCRVVVYVLTQQVTVLIQVLATSLALAEQEGAGLRGLLRK
jgi:hypothetical protein